MIIRGLKAHWSLARKTLLLLSVTALIAIGHGAARSEASQHPTPPAKTAASDPDGGPTQSQHDASSPDRSQDAAQAEWRLRL